MLLTPAQIKPKSFESRRNSLFLPGVDAPHVYVRGLGRLVASTVEYPNLAPEGAPFGDKECPFSNVSNIVQELWESRGGRPGLSVLTSLLVVSVDVKKVIEPCFGIGHNLSLICH